MKTKELIAALQQLGQEAEVHVNLESFINGQAYSSIHLVVVAVEQWFYDQPESPVEIKVDQKHPWGDVGTISFAAVNLPKEDSV